MKWTERLSIYQTSSSRKINKWQVPWLKLKEIDNLYSFYYSFSLFNVGIKLSYQVYSVELLQNE